MEQGGRIWLPAYGVGPRKATTFRGDKISKSDYHKEEFFMTVSLRWALSLQSSWKHSLRMRKCTVVSWQRRRRVSEGVLPDVNIRSTSVMERSMGNFDITVLFGRQV